MSRVANPGTKIYQYTSNLERILVSACLLGDRVRYDGGTKPVVDTLLTHWQQQNRLIKICPEIAGGLPTPRAAAEIQNGDGDNVLTGEAIVLNTEDKDVSLVFINGAHAALKLAKQHDIKFALLKANSPSCANEKTHNGQFDETYRDGMGVTAALLSQHGISVYNEHQINQLSSALNSLENP